MVAGDEYKLPRGVFALLVISSFIVGIYRFLVTHYLLRKNTSELVACFTFALVITITSSVILVSHFQLLGIALSVLLGSISLCVIVSIRRNKEFSIKLHYNLNYFLIFFALALACIEPISKWNLHSGFRWVDLLISSSIVVLIIYFVYHEKPKKLIEHDSTY
jgi:O-antigen/teichoic acid export membrane protein